MQNAPFYSDWNFWTAVFAAIAIVLSQLPPVYLWLRPKRLSVEVHSRINITHWIGNPNTAIYVSVRNTGGRALRVTAMNLAIVRDGKPVASLRGNSYFETPSATAAVMFVPFALEPGESWSHSMGFFNHLDRQAEKQYRANESALTADIRERLSKRLAADSNAVIADAKLVDPFHKQFKDLFVWQPGEYVATLTVQGEDSSSFEQCYRFTLYESDTRDLEAITDGYKFGAGISYKNDNLAGVHIPLTEHVGKA